MRKKYKPSVPLNEIRKAGIVERDLSPAQRAGMYWRSAHRWLPWVNLWVKGCCVVALVGALACLVIVFSRPRPILLASFPDGTTVCSLPPLDPKTGRVIPRPSSEAEICRKLAARYGRADDEQNAEFAKFSQAEPAKKNAASPPMGLQPAPITQAQVPVALPNQVQADP